MMCMYLKGVALLPPKVPKLKSTVVANPVPSVPVTAAGELRFATKKIPAGVPTSLKAASVSTVIELNEPLFSDV